MGVELGHTMDGTKRIAYDTDMSKFLFEHSVKKLKRAGKTLSLRANDTEAFHVMNDWRKSHVHPLNTFYTTLKRKAAKISKTATIAQRIKRAQSIISKLNREEGMALNRMQDIAGCRAIMPSLKSVYKLRDMYLHEVQFRHKLVTSFSWLSRLTSLLGDDD